MVIPPISNQLPGPGPHPKGGVGGGGSGGGGGAGRAGSGPGPHPKGGVGGGDGPTPKGFPPGRFSAEDDPAGPRLAEAV